MTTFGNDNQGLIIYIARMNLEYWSLKLVIIRIVCIVFLTLRYSLKAFVFSLLYVGLVYIS